MTESSKVAWVFPGQGSQFVGMGKQLCDEFSEAKQTFQEADDALGFALSRLCFDGPEDELKLTENTQPAILTTSVAALRAWQSQSDRLPDYVAGHSLGEYSALVSVGALSFADAVRTVRERGRLMQQAVPAGTGAMAVVMGLDMAVIESVCAEAGESEVVAPANFNGGGQIVIAGAKNAVARAMTRAKERGAKRVLELPVSAPFHCPLMRPAAEGLKRVLNGIAVMPFDIAVVTNVEAKPNRDVGRVKSLLVEQAVRPVRWEESVNQLHALGCRRAYEIGPGKVLRGLIKRIQPEIEVENIETPADIGKANGVPS